MIIALLKYAWRLRNRDRIPLLPARMLRTDYGTPDRPDQRVIGKLGARDVAGVTVAMKRAGVDTPQALADLLKHQKPRRHFRNRLNWAIARFLRSTPYNPHRQDIIAAVKPRRTNQAVVDAERRLRDLVRDMRDS